MKFSKVSEHNYKDEIFKISKLFCRNARHLYELEDRNGTLNEGKFYGEELTPVPATKRTTYKIDKNLDKRCRKGIPQYLVRWKEYRKDFDSWVPAPSVKNISTRILIDFMCLFRSRPLEGL